MSDHQPSWMPEVGEIDRAVGSYIPSHRVAAIRALIASAVEKALAEQREQHATALLRAKKDALDFAISCYAEEKAEQEARHKREVLEAHKREMESLLALGYINPSVRVSVVALLSDLRAELAALDAGEEAKP